MSSDVERMESFLSKNLPYQPSLVPFPNFGNVREVIYRYKKELFDGYSVLKDLHNWSCRKKNQPKVVPRYSDFVFNEENFQKIVCRCTDDENLTKTIFNGNDEVFVLYSYATDVSAYKIPKQQMRRLEVSDKEIIRDHLNGRTIADAKRMLQEADFLITNQARYCDNVKKTKSTGGTTTNPMALATYSSLRSNCHFQTENDSGKVQFQFFELYDSNLDIFFSAAPTTSEKKAYDDKILEIFNMSKDDARENIKQILNSAKDGYQFESGIFIDTTFGISDGFVTFIVGLVKNFRSKGDRKLRTILLGSMISTTKREENHQEFASYLKRYAQKNWPSKKIPFIMSDGEKSLRAYSEVLETSHLLCSVHLIDNLNHASRTKDDFEKMKALIFGRNPNLIHSKCLLTSISDSQFDKSFQYIIGKSTSSQRNWLTKRRIDLRDKASWKARLQGGFFQHLPTNNILESFNNVIGGSVNRKESAETLVQVLSNIANNQYDQLYRAIDRKDAEVIYDNDIDFTVADDKTRSKLLNELGFKFTNILSWEIPSRLQAHLNIGKLSRSLSKSVHFTANDYKDDYIVECKSTDSIYHVKTTDGKLLHCTSCKSTDPLDWCIHILTVLDHLEQTERALILYRYSDFIDKTSSKVFLRKAADKNAGRKTKRKYTAASKHNRKRRVEDLSLSSMQSSLVVDSHEESTDSDAPSMIVDSNSNRRDSLFSSDEDDIGDDKSRCRPDMNITYNISDEPAYHNSDLSSSFLPKLSSTHLSEDSISTRTRARMVKKEQRELDEYSSQYSTIY